MSPLIFPSLISFCSHPRVTNVCRFKQNELAFSKIVRTCDRLTFLDLSGFSHFYKVDRRGNLNFELPFPKMTKLTTLNLSGASVSGKENKKKATLLIVFFFWKKKKKEKR